MTGLRVLAIALTALTALLLGGCGLFDDPEPPPVVSAQPTPRPTGTVRVPTEDELRAALLSAAEVPGRYTAAPPETSVAAGLGTSVQGCGSPSAAPERDASRSVTAVFQGGLTGPFVAELLAAAPRVSDAVNAMAALRTAPAECGEFTGEGSISVRLGELSFPNAGDETAAFRMTATVGGSEFTLYAHVVTVRLGATLVMVTLLQLTPPETTTTEGVVKAAVEKVRRTLPTS